MASHDEAISNFCALTGSSAKEAEEYLVSSNWDIESAVTGYYADQEEGAPTAGSSSAQAPPEPEYTGPRTLDGRPAPQYAGKSASASKKPVKRTGLATLGSLGGGHDDDDDDDDDDYDDDERRGPRDLFAGGEKSGLAVQDPAQHSSNPKKLIDDIVAKAKANAKGSESQSSRDTPSPSVSRFRGSGQTLGGDGVESRVIPDPRAPAPSARDVEVQERVLHLWNDGFSIDDGPLRRFDDPDIQTELQMIRNGRAPLHLMNVRLDQPVDVKLQQHNEDYHPLPKVYRPFGGEGRRLGSVVPGESSTTPPSQTTATTTAPAPANASSQSSSTGVDESQPTLTLRIQMPDGTRLPARFNTTQTVGDVYEFVQRASPATTSRAWVLATTFPNKEHTDKSLVLGDVAEFKKGGTAVVKWA